MIRLGVVSDSHGRPQWLARYLALCKRERYDAVFHLGDHDSDARWLEKELGRPVLSVAGNCDGMSQGPRMLIQQYGGHRILAVHGHMQGVKYGYRELSDAAREQGADVALFGHTHCPYVGWEDGVLLINPGALMDGCYALVTLKDGQVVPVLRTFAERPRW